MSAFGDLIVRKWETGYPTTGSQFDGIFTESPQDSSGNITLSISPISANLETDEETAFNPYITYPNGTFPMVILSITQNGTPIITTKLTVTKTTGNRIAFSNPNPSIGSILSNNTAYTLQFMIIGQQVAPTTVNPTLLLTIGMIGLFFVGIAIVSFIMLIVIVTRRNAKNKKEKYALLKK